MKLSELIKNIEYEKILGNTNVEISGLSTDSRRVSKGDLFFCYAGGKYDSHNYVDEAIRRGAVAIICQTPFDKSAVQIIVKDGREQVAKIARAFYGFPDKKLKIVGVTGTNGKTTITHMLYEIFNGAGNKSGIIGTLGVKFADRIISPELTTPDPIYLFRVLDEMVKSKIKYVFMEVSAHALYYNKIDGITFEVGIFTNCTQDHLDFFADMAEYGRTKALMFKDGRCKYAVINSDDSLGIKLSSSLKNVVSYGIENPADVFAVDIIQNISGTKYVINLFDELYEIQLNMLALHNVYNSMAAAVCSKLLGIKTEDVAKGLKNLGGVEGRLEKVAYFNGGAIFVDFAHTPDGLEKSLKSLKGLCKNRLICVFGCGGNRDRSKRPIMGSLAAKYADFIVLTSDNPRFEDAHDIIRDIEKGMKNKCENYVTVTERETAIEYAINLMTKGDILLVAGKGGEHYQEIMGIKHSYNDNTIIKKIIGEF